MVEPTKKVWMDGKLVDWDDARIHVTTHALHYGYGAFEGIRCYRQAGGKSAIFRLKAHIRRLFDGVKILALDFGYTQDDMMKACVETVRANGLDECYVRPLVFMGQGKLGLAAHNPAQAVIAVWKWGVYLGEGALENGIRAKVSSFNRHHVNVGMVQGKLIGQYITGILAKHEANRMGYDEAVMLDTQGYVAECTGENIFAVRDGVLITPPITSPILPGVTRNTVIRLARDMDMRVEEEKFTRDFLYICDEAFLTGTAAEVTPLREVDDRPIGAGKPGPVTMRVQKAFFDVVRGEDQRYQRWLTILECHSIECALLWEGAFFCFNSL
jgi:branched-chain amino acid aminotransferase